MGRFRSTRAAFRSIADTLGFLEADAATTEYENGPVRPFLDVQGSIEHQVVFSEFILGRTDVAAVDTTVDVQVHVLGDWDEIRTGGVTFAGVAGSEVPPSWDAWIIRAGVSVSASAVNFTDADLFTVAPVIGVGSAMVDMWFGDTELPSGNVVRNSTHDSPQIVPYPWWIPPVDQQTNTLRFRLRSSDAVTSNLVLGVLSAPPGTFKRLY